MNTNLERLDPSFAVVSTDEARQILGGTADKGPESTADDKSAHFEWHNEPTIKPTSIEWP